MAVGTLASVDTSVDFWGVSEGCVCESRGAGDLPHAGGERVRRLAGSGADGVRGVAGRAAGRRTPR